MHFKGGLDQKGALRRTLGIVFVLTLLAAVMMAHYTLSAETVDSKIASNEFVDVGHASEMEREKVHLDLVKNTLTEKCLLVDSWDNSLGDEDLAFHLRDYNFPVNGKARLYEIVEKSKIERRNLVYDDVPYDCMVYDNETEQEVEGTCYERVLSSYDNVTVYYDEDEFVGSFDLSNDIAAGTVDFSGGKRLKLCFKTAVVSNGYGWGNKGTMFVEMGDRLLVDRQGEEVGE